MLIHVDLTRRTTSHAATFTWMTSPCGGMSNDAYLKGSAVKLRVRRRSSASRRGAALPVPHALEDEPARRRPPLDASLHLGLRHFQRLHNSMEPKPFKRLIGRKGAACGEQMAFSAGMQTNHASRQATGLRLPCAVNPGRSPAFVQTPCYLPFSASRMAHWGTLVPVHCAIVASSVAWISSRSRIRRVTAARCICVVAITSAHVCAPVSVSDSSERISSMEKPRSRACMMNCNL